MRVEGATAGLVWKGRHEEEQDLHFRVRNFNSVLKGCILYLIVVLGETIGKKTPHGDFNSVVGWALGFIVLRSEDSTNPILLSQQKA